MDAMETKIDEIADHIYQLSTLCRASQASAWASISS